MTVFDFVQQFILFVIPGFLSHMLFSYLTGRKSEHEYTEIFYIFLESIVAFILCNVVMIAVNALFNSNYSLVKITQIISGDNHSLTTGVLVVAITISVVQGYILTAIINKNVLFLIANKLHVTYKEGNDEVWNYLFNEQPWVVIRDYVSKNVYYGIVSKYSDEGPIREILMEDVMVYSQNDGDYKMKSVYIARNPNEFSIEIDDYNKETENGEKKDCSGVQIPKAD